MNTWYGLKIGCLTACTVPNVKFTAAVTFHACKWRYVSCCVLVLFVKMSDKFQLFRVDKLALRNDAFRNKDHITTTRYFISAKCEMPPSVLLIRS